MYRFLNAVRLAVRNLTLHKLRSLLTILGLIFGVSSVVAMLAIAEGASLEAQRQIAELGATNIILRSTKPVDEANPSKQRSDDSFILTYGLTYKDFIRITTNVPTVVGATPIREFPRSFRYHEQEIEGRVVGGNPDYLKLTGQAMADGRFLSDVDFELRSNVVVLGHELALKLFPFGSPVGKSVRIGPDQYFEVIGTTNYKAPSGNTGSSLSGQDLNKAAYIPLTTDRARFGDILADLKQGSQTFEKVELTQITVAVDRIESVKKTAEVLESMIAQFHTKKDFGVTVPLELLEKAEATKRIFNLVLGSIASISLLVGGIGIMNIMLATVSERTREIGIRRALGARRRDITLQFLIETAVMSATGGLIGVGLGIAAPPLVSKLSGIPVVISPAAPIIAFMTAVSIGLIFGVYPARRASMMDPVEALRYE